MDSEERRFTGRIVTSEPTIEDLLARNRKLQARVTELERQNEALREDQKAQSKLFKNDMVEMSRHIERQ